MAVLRSLYGAGLRSSNQTKAEAGARHAEEALSIFRERGEPVWSVATSHSMALRLLASPSALTAMTDRRCIASSRAAPRSRGQEPAPTPAGEPSLSDVRTLVEADQIHLLYSRGRAPYVGNFVNASVFAFVLWGQLPHLRIVVWVAALAISNLARALLDRAYCRRQPPPSEAGRWAARFAAATKRNMGRGRLKQITFNLLSNAAKYGGAKPVLVALTGDQEHAVLSVADEGIGMTRRRVGARLQQVRARGAPAKLYGGLGLGLFIVRQLVTAMGGTVDVQSRPLHGTRVTVSLPRSLATHDRDERARTIDGAIG